MLLKNWKKEKKRKEKPLYKTIKPPVCRGSSNNQNRQFFDSDFFEKTGIHDSPILKYLNTQCIFFVYCLGGSFQKMECPRKSHSSGGVFFFPSFFHFFSWYLMVFSMIPARYQGIFLIKIKKKLEQVFTLHKAWGPGALLNTQDRPFFFYTSNLWLGRKAVMTQSPESLFLSLPPRPFSAI